MQFFFYCTPDELKEVFSEAESLINIVYLPRLLNLTWVREIDGALNEPLESYKNFYNFGQIYPLNEGFLVYCPSDPMIGTYLPAHLKFSGPPYSVADLRLICEGSLCLLSENKNPLDRNIFKTIRRCIAKRFKKIGYAYLSPTIYEKRHEVIFLQQNANALTSPWFMDNEDQLKPIRINDYYEGQGETLEQRRHHDWNIYFFAHEEDLVEILGELEMEYNLKYVPCGKLRYQSTIQHSVHDLIATDNYQIIPWVIYEEEHRLLLHLKFSCFKDTSDLFIEACHSCCSPNPFGVALYEDFLSKLKARFYTVSTSDGETYYLSPKVFPYRHEMIFKLEDYEFRIEEDNTLVKI